MGCAASLGLNLTSLHRTPARSSGASGLCKLERFKSSSHWLPSTCTAHTVTTWNLASRLHPSERAAFAVTSRLLASIVTESLLRAYYVPISSDEACGVCVILSTYVLGEHPTITRPLRPAGVFAIIPLHQEPVLTGAFTGHGRLISLLDPLDMVPAFFDISSRESGLGENSSLQRSILSSLVSPSWQLGEAALLTQSRDPLHWWRKFAADVMVGSDIIASLAEELSSSYIWQSALGRIRKPSVCPTVFSSTIEWEHSVVEGHPTHPMHRARHAVSPLPQHDPQSRDWNNPRIHFAVVSSSRLDILGPFEREIRAVTGIASRVSGRLLPERDGCIIVPVYDLQVANLRSKFPDVEILDEELSIPALGQTSIRTVVFPEVPDIALKLSVGIRVSSALRTISHFTANFGPRFSKEIIASAICSRDATGVSLDPDVAKHFTVVIRKQYLPDDTEAVIMCAALLETGHSGLPPGTPIVQHVMGLDSRTKRLAFFDQYSRLLVAAVVPPLLHNGVAFEAHPQNTLLRLSRTSLTPTGFVLRDLGGLRVHPLTLHTSTGCQFSFLPEHCVVTSTREEAAKKLYHTLIHNHLHRLARVLRLHGDGSAWSLVRAHLTCEIPRSSWLWSTWMDDGVTNLPGKCLMRMKLEGVYREVSTS
ncbi:IucC family-domain-containing protein [Multifurca ochricompacta]|uniref:IucC family-domain-containing protein n=1 Tax=Multifurca ochricompacta TaxID=376703 RepID=A0AAD4M667_9AGAM|nr:IucC family-domain-containing protein [Multifurca ochricompacta]